MNTISGGYSSTCKAMSSSAWRGFTNVKRANCNSFLSAVMSDDPLVVQTKFTYFKTKLTSLKKVTGNYFNKLVSALEGGLSEISSKNQKRKGLWETCRPHASSRKITLLLLCGWGLDLWACTYINPVSTRRCEMCTPQIPRGAWLLVLWTLHLCKFSVYKLVRDADDFEWCWVLVMHIIQGMEGSYIGME